MQTQTQESSLAATEAAGDAFTIEKAQDGKSIIIYNADRAFGATSGQLANCGSLSKLAEMSLTAAGMTILGESLVKEMEIEILSDEISGSLEAAAEIMFSEENCATGRSDIRAWNNGRKGPLVARAYGTVSRIEKPFPQSKRLDG